MEHLGSWLIAGDHIHNHHIYLALNTVETEDDWLQIGQKTYDGDFYQVSKIINQQIVPEKYPNVYFM